MVDDQNAEQPDFGLEVEKVKSKVPPSRRASKKGALPFQAELRPLGEHFELDITRDKERLINIVQALIKQGNGEATDEIKARVYEELVLPFMGKREIKRVDRYNVVGGGEENGIGFEGENFAAMSDGHILNDSVVIGDSAYISAHRAKIRGSILVGNKDFAGSRFDTDTDYRSNDCLAPEVSNSIILGRYIFGNTRNGYIRDSIIAGSAALYLPWDGLRLVNVTVITPEGVTHYNNHEFSRKVRVEGQGPLYQSRKNSK